MTTIPASPAVPSPSPGPWTTPAVIPPPPLSPASIAAEAARARRRVKPEKRKRSAISCDLCKAKRIRCKRSKLGEPCEACIKAKVDCTHDAPRKIRRVFGSEAAVLFPGHAYLPTSTRSSGHERRSSGLSDRGDETGMRLKASVSTQRAETMPRQPSSSVSPAPHGPTIDHDRRASSTAAVATACSSTFGGDASIGPSTANPSPESFVPPEAVSCGPSAPSGPAYAEAGLRESSSRPAGAATGSSPVSPETEISTLSPGLLQADLRGRPRYVGPSASLHFFAQLRDIMSKHEPNSEFVRNGLFRALASFEDPLQGPVKERGPKGGGRGPADGPGRRMESGSAPPSSSIRGAWPSREWKGLTKTGPLKMPARWLADTLVEAFFTRVHGDFVVFHRATFWCRYESMWNASGSNFEQDSAWTCSVCMVLVLGASAIMGNVAPFGNNKGASGNGTGCQISSSQAQSPADAAPRTDSYGLAGVASNTLKGIQRRYYRHVEALLPRVLCGSSLANIQAILLVAVYIHNEDEREATWNLTGSAVRMAFATGMHRKESAGGQLQSEFGTLEREMRKRLWWTLFTFERFLCSSMGRPSSINDDDVDADLPKDSILDTSDQGPLGYLCQNVRLFQLVGRICKTVYNPINQPEDKTAVAVALFDELKAWREAVPAHLDLDIPQIPTHRRALLLLHIQYHNAISLLTRPFLILETNDAGPSDPFAHMDGPIGDGHWKQQAELAYTCVKSAQACVALLQTLRTEGLFNATTWFDTWWTYSSAMILAIPVIWKHGRRAPRGDNQRGIQGRQATGRSTLESPDDDAGRRGASESGGDMPVAEQAELSVAPAASSNGSSPPAVLKVETAERAKEDFRTCLDLLDGLALRGTLARFAEVMNNLAKAVGVSVSLRHGRERSGRRGQPGAREGNAERLGSCHEAGTLSGTSKVLQAHLSRGREQAKVRVVPVEPSSEAFNLPRHDLSPLTSPNSVGPSPTGAQSIQQVDSSAQASTSRTPFPFQMLTPMTGQMIRRDSVSGDGYGLHNGADASSLDGTLGPSPGAMSDFRAQLLHPQHDGSRVYDDWAGVFEGPLGIFSGLSMTEPAGGGDGLWGDRAGVGVGAMGGTGVGDERTAWEVAMNWNWDQISSALLQSNPL